MSVFEDDINCEPYGILLRTVLVICVIMFSENAPPTDEQTIN